MAKRKVIKPKDRKTGLQIAFGKRVRELRLEKKLSEEELADLKRREQELEQELQKVRTRMEKVREET